MLGIRLPREAEERLGRHARELGRPKSVIARDWILERLERDDIDEMMRKAAEHLAMHETKADRDRTIAMSGAFSRFLDELDGGYDWGPEGPPAVE